MIKYLKFINNKNKDYVGFSTVYNEDKNIFELIITDTGLDSSFYERIIKCFNGNNVITTLSDYEPKLLEIPRVAFNLIKFSYKLFIIYEKLEKIKAFL